MSQVPQWLVGVLVIAAVVGLGAFYMGQSPALKPAVMDVSELASNSQEVMKGFYMVPVARVRSGEVAWGRFENVDIPMHYHSQNEVVYSLQGQVTLKLADGASSTLGPGQLIIIPAGVALGVSGSGDFLFFVTPPENERDTVWLEGPMAKPAAKAPSMKKPEIIDVAQRIAQGLDQRLEGFQYTVVYEGETGSVELFRIETGVTLHHHPKENHILYILKGQGKGQVGDVTAEVGPGQIVVIPAGVKHKLERIGDEPLDFILFSTPPFVADDIIWDEKMAQSTQYSKRPTPAMGFELHIDAKKHINDAPDFVVHHFCKTLDEQVTQCLLFDSDAPNAHAIGVETIISPQIYAQLPDEEQQNWHYHKEEIPLVEPVFPGLSEAEIQKVAAAIEDTYGKVVIFWVPGTIAPMGTPSVTQPWTWSQIYFEKVFTVEQAKALGYVVVDPECVPGMGYHYIKPSEAEQWFNGKAGGAQVLLYDRTGFLVGVEYVITAPSLDAPAILGMAGPMAGHTPGMPIHYDQHIYFRQPLCP